MIAGSKVSEKTASYTVFIFQHKGSKAHMSNLLNTLVNSMSLNYKNINLHFGSTPLTLFLLYFLNFFKL